MDQRSKHTSKAPGTPGIPPRKPEVKDHKEPGIWENAGNIIIGILLISAATALLIWAAGFFL